MSFDIVYGFAFNMRKTKWHILGGALFCLLIIGLAGYLINPAKAQTTSTTFPVDEEGIAAYVKLDSVDITDLTEALNYFASIKKQGKTYVIGTKGLIIDTGIRHIARKPITTL